jgi:predicted RNA-binding Zn ribbon-like protein
MTPSTELWDWLGDPLAVDFANTVRREGTSYRELLRSGADVATWCAREDGRVPCIDEATADDALARIRAFRDDVFAVLAAASAEAPFPHGPRRRLNACAMAHPLVDQLEAEPGRTAVVPAGTTPAVDELLARVARSAIELAGSPGALALCDAPSCGQFFLRDRPNQHWCGGACGTRARVARHAGHQVRPYVPPAPPSALR